MSNNSPKEDVQKTYVLMNQSIEDMIKILISLIEDLEEVGLDEKYSFALMMTTFSMFTHHVFELFKPNFKYDDYEDFLKKNKECIEGLDEKKSSENL